MLQKQAGSGNQRRPAGATVERVSASVTSAVGVGRVGPDGSFYFVPTWRRGTRKSRGEHAHAQVPLTTRLIKRMAPETCEAFLFALGIFLLGVFVVLYPSSGQHGHAGLTA